MPEGFTVRLLTEQDAAVYNRFFLEGVHAHPGLFRIAPEDFAARPFPTVSGRDGFTLGAFDADGGWLGVVTFEREQGRARRRHVGWIVRMYVAGAAAGSGIGRRLLREALGRAADLPGVEQINLTVVATNEPARRLYLSEGFCSFAREPRAIKTDGGYLDEEQMSLALSEWRGRGNGNQESP